MWMEMSRHCSRGRDMERGWALGDGEGSGQWQCPTQARTKPQHRIRALDTCPACPSVALPIFLTLNTPAV
jgi:hypothetical protein